MVKSRSVSIDKSLKSARNDGDGKEIGNLLLSAIARQEWARLSPSLELVRLKLHQVLHEAGEAIKSVYFLNNGLGSVLTILPDGKSVEVGLIGNEGFVGVSVIFGFKTSPLRIMIQSDATAYRVDVQSLRKILPDCPTFENSFSVLR